MRLVDVILPLAMSDVLTYGVPAGMVSPCPGMRVIVPLGKQKTLMGVVLCEHTTELAPSVKLRELLEVEDDKPMVTEMQLRLWQWMADYYMCTLGEVLSAAIPSGIIDDNYKAAVERTIQLAEAYTDESALHTLLDTLHRQAPRREHLLLTYLGMASPNAQPPYGAVERRALLEADGGSSAMLHAMVERGILTDTMREVSRLPDYSAAVHAPYPLDEQQTAAIAAIGDSWRTHEVTLLHGVTSSGKTEVYIHLIEAMLREDKTVLYLVPEIALTTQLTDRLRAVFGQRMVVYHSRFSADARVEIYQRVLTSSEAMLVIGARSAVLLPMQRLGLVIVDEEHETSYKQQDPAPRYHARSVAVMLAQMHGAKVLMGTATPSMESYANAMNDKYGLVEMTERYRGLQLPRTRLIDLNRQYHRREMYGHLSDPLVARMREEIGQGKQVILFLNRRGYAPLLECPDCGYVPHCANCDVSLTYHKYRRMMVCHYCGYATSAITTCPQCHATLREQGYGTERLEEEIAELFPDARVGRMDLDSTRRKDSYQQIIDDFSAHRMDILIGTQMVTKGLHFDDVSLVAVLNADRLLNQPDFRSTERAFQMLEQVSGRAGRTGQQGEVIIQAFDADNAFYTLLKAHDYKRLFEQQMADRQRFHYPPYYRLVVIEMKHHDEHRLDAAAELMRQALGQVFGARCSNVLWPAVAKVQNQYQRHIRLTIEVGANITRAKQMLREQIAWIRRQEACKGVTVQIDVDPL